MEMIVILVCTLIILIGMASIDIHLKEIRDEIKKLQSKDR